MDATQRRDRIREQVDRDGYVRLSLLSEQYGVAPVTIHRDLEFLENAKAIERVRGGARSRAAPNPRIHTDYAYRSTHMTEQKRAIAERVRAEVMDGSTVFLDSSTTVFELARVLERDPPRSLTVVTNSPAIAYHLTSPAIHIVVPPGEVNQSLRSIGGRWTAEFLQSLSISTAFVSAAGITTRGGLMTTQRELAEVTKAVFPRTDRKIALVDSSKFGVSALVTMAEIAELDEVVTDDGVEQGVIDAYRSAGIQLVTT